MVRALFVQLRERGYLIPCAIRRFSPDQRVLVVRDERLLKISGCPCSAQPPWIATRREVLCVARITPSNQDGVECGPDGQVATATSRAVELEIEVRLRRGRCERAEIVSSVTAAALLRFGKRGCVSGGSSHFGRVHEETGLEYVSHRRPESWITAVDEIRARRSDVSSDARVYVRDPGRQHLLHPIVNDKLIVKGGVLRAL